MEQWGWSLKKRTICRYFRYSEADVYKSVDVIALALLALLVRCALELCFQFKCSSAMLIQFCLTFTALYIFFYIYLLSVDIVVKSSQFSACRLKEALLKFKGIVQWKLRGVMLYINRFIDFNLVIASLYILIYFNSCGYVLQNFLCYLREKPITF